MRMSASPAAHAPENVPPKRFRPVITPMLSTPTNASPAAPAQVFARRRLFRRSKPDISRIRKRGMAAAVPLFVSPAGTSSPLSARQTAIFRNFACKKGKHDEFRNHPRQSARPGAAHFRRSAVALRNGPARTAFPPGRRTAPQCSGRARYRDLADRPQRQHHQRLHLGL